MPKIISIGTFKGGVGKTMTTLNIAGILAERGYRVLAIDIDPQGNLTTILGIDRATKTLKGINKVFSDKIKTTFDDVLIKSPVKALSNLDLIPSTALLHESELDLALATARELRLKYFIMDNQKEFDKYDYVLIDTSPSMGYLNQNAFMVSDKIVMPATADLSDVDGINLFCALWDRIRSKLRIDDNIAGIFIARLDKRISLDRDFRDFLLTDEETQDIAELLLDTEIPNNAKLKEAAIHKKPINIYDKHCKGYMSYNELVNELIEKGIL
jgi:chromosome partitioning protein